MKMRHLRCSLKRVSSACFCCCRAARLLAVCAVGRPPDAFFLDLDMILMTGTM